MEDPTIVAEEEVVEEVVEPVEPIEPAEPTEPAEPAEPVEPAEPRKKSAQERINEITRARREAEREAEYWRNLAVKPEPAKQTSDRPKVDDFETTEEYEDALISWHDNKRAAASGMAEQQRRQSEMLRTFNEKASALRKTHEDFDEMIESPVFTDTMREVVLSADTGPELAYYLGSNRDVANKIARLPSTLQPYEIGKLETQIKLAQKTKKVTSAPAPLSPIGSTTGGGEKDPSKMSTEEWMRWDKEQRLEKIKRKLGG